MVGMVIPIQIEGGGGGASPAKYSYQRKGSDAMLRKHLRKKNSRQKCRTFNIEIELEGVSGKDPTERKNGISSKGSSKGSVSVPSKKIARRTSSKDLRGVIRRTSSKDLRTGMMRRQSSRDIISRVIPGADNGDVCLPSLDSRFTIRRDSINGLRIVSKLDQTETEVLHGLADIALSQEKTEFSKFQTEALKTHNIYREKHGVEGLVLCHQLCARAQQYADRLASTDTFEHSGDPDLGENLYWSWSSDPGWECGGREPVVSWYEESVGYSYHTEPADTQAGHFTQLVWSDSRQLGVGVRKSKKTGKFYVVMKYDPPGNVIGSYTRHVKRPQPEH